MPLAHLTMHKFSPLWRVHRVHHSDVHVDITTTFRQHPIESIWRFSLTTGLAFLLGLPPAAIAIYRLVSGLNALFEHMNVRLWEPLDRLVSVLFVTPNMHKMHHSRKMAETDSNYGNVFSVFDRVFRTFTQPRLPGLDYGLIGFDGGDSVGKLLAMPFKENK